MLRCFLVFPAVCSFFCSCVGGASNDWKIDLCFKNTGIVFAIDEASVQWGEYKSTFGIVSTNGEATIVSFDYPIPETAMVRYSLPDGREVAKTVAVQSAIPAAASKDKDITVVFEVNSSTDEITVKVLHFIQKDGYSQLVPFDSNSLQREPRGRTESAD